MRTSPQEFADLLGAKIIGEVPDVGGGPFGMARLAHIMHQRLAISAADSSAVISRSPTSAEDCVLGTQYSSPRAGAGQIDKQPSKHETRD